MDDKFILMNMDDEGSKKVAEVLGNKTCKKILNYLTDNSNKSEEDISKELKIPINTVEYNLKKLLNAGLIKKSSKFFWSKKGKKIVLYNLAKKHIIISPKNSKLDFKSLNSILPIMLAAVFAVAIILLLVFAPSNGNINITEENKFQTFDSLKDMESFIKDHQANARNWFGGFGGPIKSGVGVMESSTAGSDSSSGSGANDFSTTNIQVSGVDEADIIKNDGKYIYTVSGDKISIINAYPADNMEILSEIENLNGNIVEILINENQLIIFSNDYSSADNFEKEVCRGCDLPKNYREQRSLIYIYDISDKENPELEDEISVTGNYFDSRMINDYVYIITNHYIYDKPILPSILEKGELRVIEPNDIYYQDINDFNFQYTIVLAIDLKDASTTEKVMLTGSTQNLYVSQNNIYTVSPQRAIWSSPESGERPIIVEEAKTLVNKISIDELDIEFTASGEVKGYILNQFSMDEFENNFRVATTSGNIWNEENPSQNNVYVLDEDLNTIGELEGLAPGERIYSVRFMGERGYVVTFKKVDPLFVIDLSGPTNPNVLGKLKIPGYSDYLHPYDENHIIGIGKDTIEIKSQRGTGTAALNQGVKIAIFDVSDVENPIEMHKIVIGDRGTDSEALRDHKAFLFDKEKELMVLPITLAEFKQGVDPEPWQGGDYIFQGVYVYNVNLEDGFDLKGRITHYDKDEVQKKAGFYFWGNKNIRRSLYMDNTLYTFSNEMLKANDLANELKEISFLDLI